MIDFEIPSFAIDRLSSLDDTNTQSTTLDVLNGFQTQFLIASISPIHIRLLTHDSSPIQNGLKFTSRIDSDGL